MINRKVLGLLSALQYISKGKHCFNHSAIAQWISKNSVPYNIPYARQEHSEQLPGYHKKTTAEITVLMKSKYINPITCTLGVIIF